MLENEHTYRCGDSTYWWIDANRRILACVDIPERSVSAPNGPTLAIEPPAKNPALLARLVIREGKLFAPSAIEAGYAESTAKRGLKALMEDSSAVNEAVRRETEALYVSLDKLKPLAVKRLYQEIIDPRSPNGMKAIEIAGKFKETDWFVRNAEMNLGVFLNLGEQTPDAPIEQVTKYQE